MPQQEQVSTTPIVPETPAAPKTDDMSAKFAALAKKERIARLAQYNLKTKETSLAQREQAIAERERIWEEEFKASPLEAIKKRGYTYEDITKAALNDGKFEPATEIKSVKEEIARLREEQKEKDKLALEQQQTAVQQAEQEAVDGFKFKIGEHIDGNKEKYELTALYEAHDLVFQTVEEHYLRTSKEGTPKILSVDEACALVEQYLESEIDRTAQASKKFQAKYSTGKTKEDQNTKPAPKSTTTLTNQLTSSAPSLLPQATENDRMKRALAALG